MQAYSDSGIDRRLLLVENLLMSSIKNSDRTQDTVESMSTNMKHLAVRVKNLEMNPYLSPLHDGHDTLTSTTKSTALPPEEEKVQTVHTGPTSSDVSGGASDVSTVTVVSGVAPLQPPRSVEHVPVTPVESARPAEGTGADHDALSKMKSTSNYAKKCDERLRTVA